MRAILFIGLLLVVERTGIARASVPEVWSESWAEYWIMSDHTPLQAHQRSNPVSWQREQVVPRIFVETTVSRSSVEVGEVVEFTSRVKNVALTAVEAVRWSAQLPMGFSNRRGHLRFDPADRWTGITESEGQVCATLDRLSAGAVATIRYSARAGASAIVSEGWARSWAVAQSGLVSNQAVTRVQVRAGVFTPRGTIIGRVYLDTDNDGSWGLGDWPVPGARVLMEDGSQAITDRDGAYSFYGLRAQTHVLKLDPASLPTGTVVTLISHGQAGDPESRWIELGRYELNRANFALSGPASVQAEIKARRDAASTGWAELAGSTQERLSADGAVNAVADPKGQAASGGLTGPTDVAAKVYREDSGALPPDNLPDDALVPEGGRRALASRAIEADSAVTDARLGFVGLTDGAVLAAAQTSVSVKGPAGARLELTVNERPVGADRLAYCSEVASAHAVVQHYVGLPLRVGKNRLTARMADSFGNVRGSVEISVIAPGDLARLEVALPIEGWPADGVTSREVTVRLWDAQGVRVAARTPVTLESSLGRWQVADCDPIAPGVQVFVEGGSASFALVAPSEPGVGEIGVSSGSVRERVRVAFDPHLRPLVAAGVVEGRFHFNLGTRSALLPERATDAFQEELSGLAVSTDDGRMGAGARAAFFLKGRMLGSTLLTAAYDSDRAEHERLFRDIQPGEYYPVYGDAALRGYDAQSTGRLYVRIDHQRSYLLLGDFSTESSSLGDDELRTLSNYQRSVTGVKEHYESGPVRANVWASEGRSRQLVVEIPAMGTSGPYIIDAAGGWENSERVEVLTRDRDQPSQVRSIRTMTRFFDYEFEPWTGRLLFKAPVPSLDAALNPISIRVTIEREQAGEAYWSYGADAQVAVASGVALSGSFAREDDPGAAYELRGVAASIRLTPTTTLKAELAESIVAEAAPGRAWRVKADHDGETWQVRGYASRAESAFQNASAYLLPGRTEAGFDSSYRLDGVTVVRAQGVASEILDTKTRRLGFRSEIERAFGRWKLAMGARHVKRQAGTAAQSVGESLSGRVEFPLPFGDRTLGSVEYEQDVRASDRRRLVSGCEHGFADGGRLYGRHEWISSLEGPFDLQDEARRHATVVGLDRPYMKGGQVFNEYRAGSELHRRDAEAAVGLRNLWDLGEGLHANTSFEKIVPVRGEIRDAAQAVTGAIDYDRPEDWRADVRLEIRQSAAMDSWLHTLGYAHQIGRDWTFLGKTILVLTHGKGAGAVSMRQGRVQAGFAWRPKQDDRWSALAKYECRYESRRQAEGVTDGELMHQVVADVLFTSKRRWTLSGHYAAKWVRMTLDETQSAHLLGARLSRELGRRWDAGLAAYGLADVVGRSIRWAIGPEVGLLLAKNLSVGLGYNLVGFQERDLAPDGATAQGVFLRVRLKFDEKALPRGARSAGR